MELRRANREDINEFTEFRVEFATLIPQIPDVEAFRTNTRTYLMEHIDKDDLIIFVAVDQGKIVASCMACIFITAPLPSCPSGKTAELLNVYTKEAYRGRGLAPQLLHMLIEEAKKNGVQKMILQYTQAGHPVYQKLGFEELEQQMQLKL